ncbi:Uma2 family endonuclease [Rugosimonospora acidiphila]
MTMTNPLVRHEWGAPWTLDDLASLPDDGNRYELLDGSLLVSPPPDTFHCRTVTELAGILHHASPTNLYVSGVGFGLGVRPGTLYLPDLIVFRRTALDRRAQAIEPTDVRLVVEVLSSGSSGRDLVMKRYDYAAARIPQYWIVDQERPAITVLRLDESGRHYEESAVVKPGERLRVEEPFPIDLDPAEVL